jgi:hypothetical protein
MQNALKNCPSPTKPSIDHIQSCRDEQQQLTDHLIAHLRQKIVERSNDSFNETQRECARQRKQLDRAFELYKQAEAKVQILIGHFGGGQ